MGETPDIGSYDFDAESGLYYLQSRYYNPEVGRFINADVVASTGQGIIGNNMFAYCGNNPVNRTDAAGQAWWHWAVAAAIVVAAAAAVVVTAGGATAAIVAVTCVANGVAASTTAATVAAGVFIGSSTALAASAYSAAIESNSAEEFAAHGEYALYSTAIGGAIGGASAYGMDRAQNKPLPKDAPQQGTPKHTTGTTSPRRISNPNGSHLQLDNKGNIYSYTEYDQAGNQYMRIDFQGKPHANVLPHIHLYYYLERGGRKEFIYDLYWNRIG